MNRSPHQVVAGRFLMYQSTLLRQPQVCHEANSHEAASFRPEPTIVAVCSTDSMGSTAARADNPSEMSSTNARHTDCALVSSGLSMTSLCFLDACPTACSMAPVNMPYHSATHRCRCIFALSMRLLQELRWIIPSTGAPLKFHHQILLHKTVPVAHMAFLGPTVEVRN